MPIKVGDFNIRDILSYIFKRDIKNKDDTDSSWPYNDKHFKYFVLGRIFRLRKGSHEEQSEGWGKGIKQSLIMSPNTIWADSNSAKKSFVNYIWSRLVFPLGAIVLPLSKLFIACVSRGGKVASCQGVRLLCCHICIPWLHTDNVDSVRGQ